MKYTVFFDQRNRTNFQVNANDEKEAWEKAQKLYKERFCIPSGCVQEGWLVESDGEDK